MPAERPGRFQIALNPFVDRQSVRLGVRERHYIARVRQEGEFDSRQNMNAELVQAIHGTLHNLIQGDGIPAGDRVYFGLASNRLSNNVEYRGLPAGEWVNGSHRVDEMLAQMARMLNSNEDFQLDDSFQLTLTHVQSGPRGSGKRKRKPGHTNPETFKRMKRTVVTIKNKDELCCARAIVTAKAKVDNHPHWCDFKDGRKRQQQAAVTLHQEVLLPYGPCGFEELTKLSLAPSLFDYELVLVDATRGYSVTSYGPSRDKQLVLLYDHGHYDVITSLPGFFGSSYVCARCFKPYNDQGRHACRNNPNHCPACLKTGCPDYTEAKCRWQSPTTHCTQCRRFFYGEECVQHHISHSYNGKPADGTHVSVCTQRRKCQECEKLLVGLKQQKQHKCGYVECPSCKNYVEATTHQCFVQKAKTPAEEKEEKKKKKRARRGAAVGVATLQANEDGMEDLDPDAEQDEKPPLHVFFDIEAMQDTGRHVANLVVAETEEDERPVRFKGKDCIRDFLEWLDTLTINDTREVTVIAHNFQGYDSYFIVNQYHEEHRIVKQLRNGAKLLQVVFDRIRFIDSLSFFQFPLAQFPKTFGLKELKKGHFPHLFNKPQNQDYVGPIPNEEYFMPEVMKPKAWEEFVEWHNIEVESHTPWDFQAELIAYCESDVKLLKEGCLKFKELFQETALFNPFQHVTIASACNRDLRQNRMKENTIASEPLHGWRRKTNQSLGALEWLHWQENQIGRRLQHAANQGEYRIPFSRYTVDGYDVADNTVYEFQGCYYHGCPTCYGNRTEQHRRLEDRCFEDVYQTTQRKLQFLRDKQYKVVSIWECEWNKIKQENEEVKAFVDGLKLVEPLNPRDAFFGGRTNAIKLYHKADPTNGEKVHYYDFTSLYPYVNKNGRYPVGHPEILSQPGHTDVSQYFGLAKVTVLPPYQLYHPVLPWRYDNKLLFPLCGACAREETRQPLLDRSSVCDHAPEQRCLVGTWCTPELNKAVEKGYTILHIHEVWHFDNTMEGLFADYVNTWLKIKQQSSGWPSHVGEDSQEQQQQYLDQYEAEEGIQLDPEKMVKNPGLRTLSKMMLNSMWGKFGQRSNKTQVKEFDDPKKFSAFHESDKVDIRYVSVLTEDRVEIHYKHQVEDDPVSPNLNIFVAAFTTCWARLRLYSTLDLLQERVIYMDTDSVVFTSLPGQENPPLGDYLGEFKSELDGDDYISEFVSGGPKNYGYSTSKGKTECKVRGFSLNTRGLEQLNYEVLRQNVLNEIQQPLQKARQTEVIKPYHIIRCPKEYAIETVEQKKNYRLVFNKRVVDPESFYSYPYGYLEYDPEEEEEEMQAELVADELDTSNVNLLVDLLDDDDDEELPEDRIEALLETFL